MLSTSDNKNKYYVTWIQWILALYSKSKTVKKKAAFSSRSPLSSGVHAFGLCATALITDILQLMTGYPTPYFLTVCKPNYTTLIVSCEQNPYVMEDICSGADPAAINQGR